MRVEKHRQTLDNVRNLRGMREAMLESAGILRSAATEFDDHVDVALTRLYRIQDLQAEVFRLQEALKDAARHGDENFYRVLDLQEEVQVREKQVQGLQEEVHGMQEEVHGLQQEIRGLQSERQDRHDKIDTLILELDAAHAREAAQHSSYQGHARASSEELAKWQAYAAGLRGVVGDMTSSDSWRLTWFLRAISATLRGRKSTGPALPDAPPPPGIGHDGG